MKILLIGSSPVILILANILNNQSHEVTIVESRRNIGGAWRIGKPFPQIKSLVPIYNNIMLACSEYEAINFKKALNLLEKHHIKYESPEYNVKVEKPFTKFPYKKVNIEPLVNQIQNNNILFIRNHIENIKVSDESIEVEKIGSFDYIFIPESIPIKSIYIPSRLDLKHTHIYSHHLHLLLTEDFLDKNRNTFFSEPFSKVFDRGSLLPVKTNGQTFAHFRGRISREFKNQKTLDVINSCPIISSRKIISKKRYIYISSYLSDESKNKLENKIKKLNRIKLLKTGQLVESVLELYKYLSFKK